MLSSNDWARNSQVFAGIFSTDTITFVYVCLVTAILILLHSFVINKLKVNTIRVYTDASCLSTVLASIFLLLDKESPSEINNAFLIDFGIYGILGTVIQLCDNYMTFSRYLVVYPKTTRAFKILANFYIWILLVFTYLPYETILPCFVDTNTAFLTLLNKITSGYIFMTAYLAYNLYFSYFFWYAMQKENTFGVTNKRMIFLGVKNILHIIISSVGAILQGLESTFNFAPGGCFSSFFTVNIALHFLFNWKIENSKFIKRFKILPEIESIARVGGRSSRPIVSSIVYLSGFHRSSLNGRGSCVSVNNGTISVQKEPISPISLQHKFSGKGLQSSKSQRMNSNIHNASIAALPSGSKDCGVDAPPKITYNGEVELFHSQK